MAQYTLAVARWIEMDSGQDTSEDVTGYSLWDYLPRESGPTFDTIAAAEQAAIMARNNPDPDGIVPDCVVIDAAP